MIQAGLLFDVALPSDDGVWTEPRARLHDSPVVHEARSFEQRALFDAGLRRHAYPVRARPELERLVAEPAVHDVPVYLHVLIRRADIAPVPAVDVADERLAAVDERREEAALDGPGSFPRNPIERLGLQNVDTCVDGV